MIMNKKFVILNQGSINNKIVIAFVIFVSIGMIVCQVRWRKLLFEQEGAPSISIILTEPSLSQIGPGSYLQESDGFW